MLEGIKVLGNVVFLDDDQNPVIVLRDKWLKLSEDMGGMTLIGTFVKTKLLADLKEEEQPNA